MEDNDYLRFYKDLFVFQLNRFILLFNVRHCNGYYYVAFILIMVIRSLAYHCVLLRNSCFFRFLLIYMMFLWKFHIFVSSFSFSFRYASLSFKPPDDLILFNILLMVWWYNDSVNLFKVKPLYIWNVYGFLG